MTPMFSFVYGWAIEDLCLEKRISFISHNNSHCLEPPPFTHSLCMCISPHFICYFTTFKRWRKVISLNPSSLCCCRDLLLYALTAFWFVDCRFVGKKSRFSTWRKSAIFFCCWFFPFLIKVNFFLVSLLFWLEAMRERRVKWWIF